MQDRTRKLLSSVRYLPKNLVFSPGARLEDECFRRACVSFWQPKLTFNDPNEVAEFREGLGLRVEFQGLALDASTLPEVDFLCQSVHTRTWYKGTIDRGTDIATNSTSEASNLGILTVYYVHNEMLFVMGSVEAKLHQLSSRFQQESRA